MPTSTNLTERREALTAKHKIAQAVLEQAGEDLDFKQVTEFGDGLSTQDKVEKFRVLNDELAELTRECKELELAERAASVRAIGDMLSGPGFTGIPPVHAAERIARKSLGDRIVESDSFEHFVTDRAIKATQLEGLDVKALFETGAGWEPESVRTGMVVEAVTRPIQVLDLIPGGVTGQAAIVYMEETTRTHAAAETAEAGEYPESEFVLTERSSPVRKIADTVPVTDEQLEDVEGVRSYLDNRLRFGLRQRLDNQILNGDGTSPNLRGILNVAGIQTQAKSTDPTFDAFHKAITKVRLTGRANPSGIVMHPNDWQDIRLTRTADGVYILGNPAERGAMTLFGLPVALGDVIAEGTGIVGDFANFSQLYDRRMIEVQVGYVDAQFKKGQQTIRADMRVAFAVYRATAFCTVTGI
ncbi:phage major capsid protein [Candidatus Palauibacter sp.]|uniref:phage major capsid protein n=1 Tax=Candidatus Palauibacter sp. TaxID=3101350 RepID=UPI003CC580D7